jgi:1-acyl-sn-glycerol-3-phosphate acyltransferase
MMLRIFFRRIEVAGAEHVPEGGKVMFALNHPNGLIDPLFILCLAGRPVSFLAKAPLFTMPVVGYFVRAFRCLPVYRRQDQEDPEKNRETIQQAINLLSSGNALALFPEGTSHSDPRLKAMRSGAARIALAATAASEDPGVRVIPVGLYYSRKHAFRSNALLLFGEALVPPRVELDSRFEPPRETVHAFTEQLAEGLAALTLQADTGDLIALAKSAERIVHAVARGSREEPPDMAARLAVRRRLLEGYQNIGRRPDVARLVQRIRRHEATMRSLGLKLDAPLHYDARQVFVYATRTALYTSLLLMPALLGLVTNYLTYRVVGFIAFRYAKGSLDVAATVKVLAGFLLFPVTWLALGATLFIVYGPVLGGLAVLAAPPAAYAALTFTERVTSATQYTRAWWLPLTRHGFRRRVVEERRAVHAEIVRLGQLLTERSAPLPPSGAT